MAANINQVVVTGNLTSEPELRGNGAVCTMRLAVNGRRKNGDAWEDQVGYYDLVAFGAQGENCAKFLHKGSKVAVSGRLDWSEWTTEGGEKRQAVKIVAQSIEFLNGNDKADASQPKSEVKIDTEDLPF